MVNMGYQPYSTCVSMASRRFQDDVMATYLILEHQRTQAMGRGSQVKSVHCPGPADPPWLCPSKCSSEPALPLPFEQQQPEEAKQSGQKGAGSASMPAIPLSFLNMDTPPLRLGSLRDPMPSSSSSQGTSTGQSHHRSRGWKRLRRKLSECIQKLCCVPRFPLPASRNRVVPGKNTHLRLTEAPDIQKTLNSVDADILVLE